jgi:5-methyltetrahydropteroyltriglutamate--homocysteine methyltransferase
LEHEELQTEKTRSPLLSYPVGTMLDSIYKTWRWPRVVGKVEHDPKNPLEYAKIWRIAQQSAAAMGKPVKFGTCSAQVLAFFLDSHTPHYKLEDKKQLIWDMAGAMNHELRQLAASGCRVIQVEEPTLHFMARYNPDQKEFIDFLVEAFNREVEGLDNVEIWIHTCWGNPNMQKVFKDESYAQSIAIYLERLKGDVWTIEATENDFKELSLFERYKNSLPKKIAVGVISHRTLQADFPDVVADRIRRCLKYIPADKLILSTDCGFGRQGMNRHLVFYKTTAIPMARNLVLKELGLPERYVPAADSMLAWDQLPDYEPMTHSQFGV